MLDYIHSAETEQFSFLRVPKILLQNDTFKGISAEAKLLYSILFDRTELSNRNGWRDDQDRVYIIFTIAEITESMNCGNKKAIQLLDELEHKAGLIERKRQGLGKPNLIYVKYNGPLVKTTQQKKHREHVSPILTLAAFRATVRQSQLWQPPAKRVEEP